MLSMQNFVTLSLPDSHHCRYCIAGIEVISNRAANLPRDGFTDLQLSVVFTDPDAKNSYDYTSPKWREVPGLSKPKICLYTEGDKAVVLQDGLDQESCAIAIRRLVPFASALQGEVILHASAVTINNQVVCFIAESGNGKSTFAGALRNLGYPLICDDLLPCRSRDRVFMIPHVYGNSVSMLKISMICFLSRGAALTSSELKTISPKECLKLLLLNGFGEMKDKAIWKRQFEAYGSLATMVKAYRLTIPDDLSLLEKTAIELSLQFENITRIDH